MSLIELASHNDDVQRLLEKGYALRLDSAHLVVRDIPYLDMNGARQIGAIVTQLVFVDKHRVQQQDHQIFFAGSAPHGLDGQPVRNLGGGAATVALSKSDVVVERSFSNKPPSGFADFFDKIEHYVGLISGPAMERHGGSPLTYRVDNDVAAGSVFKYQDTLTSRAEIGDLAALFNNEVIAIIGLGGTGSYVLDFLVKTPIAEIRGFDGDAYQVHNAYRSPGKLADEDLGRAKADVYQSRYENFREGLRLRHKVIDSTCSDDLAGVTFAFVCVDKGSARAEIFDLLIRLNIPFIDVGLGLNRKQNALSGTLRATYFGAGKGEQVRAMNWAELADHPDDLYRQNIQISELNALNAAIAVMRYKQLRGFYTDTNQAQHMLMETGGIRILTEQLP